MSRFEREVDPEGKLPPEERAKRAAAARSAYFSALALRATRKRAVRHPVDMNRQRARDES